MKCIWQSLWQHYQQSLRLKLLLPLLSLGLLVSVVMGYVVYVQVTQYLHRQVVSHAQALADAVNYAAESMPDTASLQRFVTALGGERAVKLIVVAAGDPLRVVASTRLAWLNQVNTQLPHEIRGHIHAGEKINQHWHENKRIFTISTPLLLLDPKITDGSLKQGMALIQLDSSAIYADAAQLMWLTLVVFVGLVLLIALIVYALMRRLILTPAREIRHAMEAYHSGRPDWRIVTHRNDEVGKVAATLNQLLTSQQELQANLSARVAEEVAKNREKDLVLIQQSRLAAMGEMIHNIAHQWRQPLNALALIFANLRDAQEYQELTPALIQQSEEKAQHILQKMSTTIDDFRNFFRPNREKERFSPARAIREAQSLVADSLAHYRIALTLDLDEHIQLLGFPNEFAQVILNLLVNAKDAILAQGQIHGQIHIRAVRETNWLVVSVNDNGGGIPLANITRVFEPYFSTKPQGSGIGLHMSRMIVEHNMGGHIGVSNTPEGACFTLQFPLI